MVLHANFFKLSQEEGLPVSSYPPLQTKYRRRYKRTDVTMYNHPKE